MTTTRRTSVFASLLISGVTLTALTGCTPAPNAPATPASAPAASGPAASAPPTPGEGATAPSPGPGATTPPADADLSSVTMPVDLQAALDVATDTAGGVTTAIGLDHSRAAGTWVWKIDRQDGSAQRELEISAADASVLKDDADTEDSTARAVDPSRLTPADAMSAALALQPGTVSEWSLEWDDGAPVYSIDVRTDSGDTEIVVDVETGDARRD